MSIIHNRVSIMLVLPFSSLCLQELLSVCSSLDLSELAKAAKKKLQSVSIVAVFDLNILLY